MHIPTIGRKSIYFTNFRLYQYNDEDFRIVKINYQKERGWQCVKKKSKITDEAEIERISLSRTKRNIRELSLCNEFEFFSTITVNSKYADRFHLDECQELLKKKLQKIKRNNKDFKYLFITEKHKNRCFSFSWFNKTASPISI